MLETLSKPEIALAALAGMSDAVITTDDQGTITFINEAARTLTGWIEESPVGLPLEQALQLVREKCRQPLTSPVVQTLSQGYTTAFEKDTVLVARDGVEHAIDGHAAPIQDEQGRMIGTVLVIRDDGGRRETERAFRKLHAYAIDIIATLREPFVVLDGDLRVQAANRAFYETFHVTQEQTEDRLLYDLGNGQWNIDRLRKLLTAVVSQNQPVHDFEVEHEFPDLGRKTMLLNAHRLPPEAAEPDFILLAIEDITERKNITETLRTSEQRLASMVESSRDAIVTKSLKGIVQSWNASAERLFGYTARQAIGQPITFMIPPDRIEEEGQIIARIRAGEHVDPFDTVRVRRDGRPVHVSLSISPIKDGLGRVIGASSIARDISERKALEERLKRTLAELSEADRRKTEFLALLAHELRNPLAPISNAVQILRITGGDVQAVESATKIMERQIGQLSRLVDDLLDVNRISRGKFELRREPINLAAVVHQAVEASRPLCEGEGHQLIASISSTPIFVHGDATRLVQVVGNLLNNACKFTPSGGRIWLTVEQEGPNAVIRVRDTGIGIAPDQIGRIFEMFTQLDPSLERSTGGLGIGLTLVKNLAEMHGGSVEARSEGMGRGSEFIVRVPALVDSPRPQAIEPSSPEAPPAARRRILVVDDNRDSARSLATLLMLAGNDTRVAHDGLEAIEVAENFRPQIILLDIGLPKLNGYEVCRRIRQQPMGVNMVIVALTGWGHEADRRRSKEAGFNHHLVKPIEVTALKKLLAEG